MAGWDADEKDLLRPRGSLGIPLPAYDGRSLPNIAASVHLAATGRRAEGRLPPLDPALDPFRGSSPEGPIVLFLVDGLGWKAFRRSVEAAGAGRTGPWAKHARPISSVFPTTTTAALVSLSSASAPSQHGVVGYRQWIPAWDCVVELLRMAPAWTEKAETLAGPGFDRRGISAVPTLFESGLSGTVVSRESFGGSSFTHLLYAGAEYVGYASLGDLAHQLAKVLERPRPPPVIYLYWDQLDHAEHARGPEPFLFATELELVRTAISAVAARVAPRVGRRTTLLVTGDHGQVGATPETRIALDEHPDLLEHLRRPPSGDRRGFYLAVRPGREESVRAVLDRLLPAGSQVIPLSSAIEQGLFGPAPHHPELRERVGDLLLLVPAPSAFSYRPPTAPAPTHFLYGAHGGLDAEELLVPLVAAPLSEFGPARTKR